MIEDNEPLVGHPNLRPEINHNIMQSEVDGGAWMEKLSPENELVVQTRNTEYRIRRDAAGKEMIKGHAKYCADWTPCRIHGSTWGGSMLKMKFVGVGMLLEFSTDRHGGITTSTIQSVREERR